LPAYVVTEYVIRRPIGALVSYLDRGGHITRFFASSNPVGAFPTFLVDFGLRPSVGLYAFADPLVHRANRFRISAAYGGPDWFTIGAKDRILLEPDGGASLVLRGGLAHRPDFPFYGIGPDARQQDETFYTAERLEVVGSLSIQRRHASYEAALHVWRDQRSGSRFGRSTDRVFDTSAIADFEGGTLYEQSLVLAFDSRPYGEQFVLSAGSGVRLDVRGGLAFGLDETSAERYVRYGAELSLFWDVTRTRRVIGMNLQLDEVDGLGGAPVPLSYMLVMGGRESMPGFFFGRFVGESTACATLDYRWPVASFIDAELFAGVGNAFGRRFDGLSPEAMVGDAGIAIRTNTSRDLSFDVLFAVGTRSFARGPLAVDTVRFTLGTNRGF
jgi:hypothetical protein